MRLTLTHKLFLLLATTTILAIAGTTTVFVIQLERGFVSYMNELDGDYVGRLVNVVADTFRTSGNLDRFEKAGWKSAHEDAFGEARTTRPSAADANTASASGERLVPLETPQRKRAPPGEGRIPQGGKPEAALKGQPRANDPFNIAPRTQLLSPSGRLIGGRPPGADVSLRQFPVVVDGQTVALVQLAGRGHTVSGREYEHLRKVRLRILAVAGAVLATALLLSYWIASRWTGRLQRVISVTQAVAQGEFAARATVQGNDEIAQLSSHVNDMALSLERLERSRRRWLADIAHELRTPLATLQGEIEGMIDGVFKCDADGLQSLHDEVRHLARLTGDLHQLALSDLGALPIHPEETDVGLLVDRAVNRWQMSAHRQQLTLRREGEAQVLATIDETRMTQVIDNLLQNSLRYTDAGGTVAVALNADPTNLHLTVDDSPPGVQSIDLERMFEPLFRADAARTRERGGSGLGLALARAIVDAHRGTITAKASKLGGVRIEVTLPRQVLI
jgi:two-component system, OmpR family, sensor histidine kinase BaeS